MSFKELPRRKVRYWLFRFQTASDKEEAPEELSSPDGLREFFEDESFEINGKSYTLDDLGGWESFAKKWDVSEEDPFEVILRVQSVWEEWNRTLRKVVPPLPLSDG